MNDSKALAAATNAPMAEGSFRNDNSPTPAERLPDFLGLGTQKGGTTTLQQLLSQHPDIHLAPGKEVHYFSKHWDQSQTWYANHFSGARPNQRCGDITPYYLFHPEAPLRIHSLLPQARLIVLLRDPVERTLSQYFHSVRLGLENLPLEQALNAEANRLSTRNPLHLQEHSYVSRSRYLEQLERYEALFSSHQLLIMRSEDLFEDPVTAWKTLEQFLELESIDLPIPLPKANAGSGEATSFDPALRQKLLEQLSETIDGMKKRYGINWSLS